MNTALLGPTDPAPYEVVNANGASPVLLTCEHAGRRIPACLGNLGLDQTEMARHIAYDLGAEELARAMSSLLDARLAIQPYSRLVVDCNRPVDAPDCVPEISDGTVIPTNLGLDQWQRALRVAAIHQPYHDVVAAMVRARSDTCLVAVHSFTPRMQGVVRPWQLGLLYNRDSSMADRLMAAITAREPTLVTALNQPYTIEDNGDYTIPVHGEAAGIPHVLLEVRNDEISNPDGRHRWASILGKAIAEITSDASRR